MLMVFNSGSSSLKFGLYDESVRCAARGIIDWASGDRSAARLRIRLAGGEKTEQVQALDDLAAARIALRSLSEASPMKVSAVGHRVVLGGLRFRGAHRIDQQVEEQIESLSNLAPLHNPPALRTIRAMGQLMPNTPQVAVFDTSFFSDLPEAATVYAIPYEWHERFGLRRFGFHGLSHRYCASRAAEMLQQHSDQLRLVCCHLGGGCSAAAIQGGKPVASTMGFSPLEGLMMGTRSGSIDPGLMLHLLTEKGFSCSELDAALNRNSGLLGLSGVSPDYGDVEKAAANGNSRAALAMDVFNDQVRAAIAALASRMNGLDALIFTDRIGEGSARMRSEVCSRLGFIGLGVDFAINQSAIPDADIATNDSRVRVLVIHTDEEQIVAQETAATLR